MAKKITKNSNKENNEVQNQITTSSETNQLESIENEYDEDLDDDCVDDEDDDEDEDVEDAFDRLLQDFINNELDEIERDNKKEKNEDNKDNKGCNKTIRDEYCGEDMIMTKYYYNRCYNLPVPSYDSAEITGMRIISEYEILKRRKTVDDNDVIRIYKDKSPMGIIKFTCDENRDYEEQQVTAFVYSPAVEEPVYVEAGYVRNGVVKFNFEWEDMYGHYFIVFNGVKLAENIPANFDTSIIDDYYEDQLKINVEIVRTEEVKTLPEIIDIKMKFTEDAILPTEMNEADYNVAKYSKCNLFISIPTDRSLSHWEHPECMIFNSTCLNIGRGGVNNDEDDVELFGKFCGLYINLFTKPKYRWLPDDYKLIIYMAKKPMYEITFSIDEDFNIGNINYRTITPDSFEFHKLKYIEKKREELKFDLHFPDIRKAIFEWVNIGTINVLQDDKCNNIVVPNRNYIVEGNYNSELKTALITNMNEAINIDNSIFVIDANKFLEPVIDPRAENEVDNLNTHNHVLIHNLSAFADGRAKVALNILSKNLAESLYFDVILMGNKAEIDAFFEAGGENLRQYFPSNHYLKVSNLDANTIMYIVDDMLEMRDMKLHDDAVVKLYNCLKKAEKANMLANWDSNRANLFVRDVLLVAYEKRISSWSNKKVYTMIEESRKYDDMKKGCKESCDEIAVILPEDIDETKFEGDKTDYNMAIEELNSLIGLEGVKRNMANASNLAKFGIVRRQLGLSAVTGTQHMIFTGNPGTGKTTVAKMVGRIYHSLGLLSKGDVIITERSKIVGRFIGETEKNMMALLEQARGNVLFIDEAYTLFDGADDRKDFGHHVLESLLTVLSQPNPDMIIIFAGYEDEINKMLNVNQGMAGRFPLKFNFEDYNATELYQIAMRLLNRENFILTHEADKLLRSTIADMATNKGKSFSNARWVEQYVHNGIVNAMATRLIQEDIVADYDSYRTITYQDIDNAYQQYGSGANKMKNTHKSVGFAIR